VSYALAHIADANDPHKTLPAQSGHAGAALVTDGSKASWSAGAAGTVTSVSVASANGFAGTVANPGTTPAITLTTTITGLLKGNGTAISAAVAGTDYALPSQTFFLGTTSIAINRASAAIVLAGITSIDGSAAKWTTARSLAGNSVDGSANVAFANKFIVQGTADTGLSAAQFLGALATGIVKNTTTTGVLSIAVAGTDYTTPTGAENLSSKTITSSTLDSSAVGATTPSTGAFTTVTTTGRAAIGGALNTGIGCFNGWSLTGNTTTFGYRGQGTIQSDVTVASYTYSAQVNTQAAAFTLTDAAGFFASQGTIGAGSAITNLYGFVAGATLLGATNNFGFAGQIAAASGRWNFYASGTANNAFAGLSRFGATTVPLNTVDITGSLGRGAPVTKTADFTLGAAENWIICNKASTLTVTLPAASSWTGREVMIKTITAQTVVSASSNVAPKNSATAGTAILAAAAGNWATLVSDGTNWIIMQGS
jgi:hypothetical protein